MKKVCCITSSRAEYSRLKSVFQHINKSENLELQVVCAGSHLLDRYGMTKNDILRDGFRIDYECDILVEGETPATMSKSLGLAIIEFTAALSNLKPDILLVLGDRFEAVASALTGAIMNIPVAHIQGGEISGSIDESFRHVITKLSHIHFPSTELSRKRIISMGEDPSYVFNVGCPAVDGFMQVSIQTPEKLFSNKIFESIMAKSTFSLEDGYLLCCFHPVTSEYEEANVQTVELLKALFPLKKHVLWFWPNVDAGARKIVKGFDHFFLKNSKNYFDHIDHVPFELFVSIMANCSLMIGNSSAGIREACYFGVPVVNVGNRQADRERPKNVVDVECKENMISRAITLQINKKYPVEHLYGDGNSAKLIVKYLSEVRINNVQKKFVDNFHQNLYSGD